MATIPKKIIDRLAKEVPVFQKILLDAKHRDVNESDTVTIVKDILDRVFGFDKYTEITSEFAIKRTYCDLAVKIEESVFYLIEVKAIGLTLKENHLRQAVNYAANHGIEWVVLTNGITWEVYCVKCEGKVTHNLICSFDFLEANPRKAEDREKMYLLCKRGVAKKAIEEYQQHVDVVNRFVIGAIMRSDSVVRVIKRELRRISPNIKTSEKQIEEILTAEVMKREIVEGESAEQAAKRVRKSAGKQLRKADTKNGNGEPGASSEKVEVAPTA